MWTTEPEPVDVLRQIFIDYSRLKDPFSARFRNVYSTPHCKSGDSCKRKRYCGEINAKNAYGAYIGWTYFYAVPRVDDSWSVGLSKYLDAEAAIAHAASNPNTDIYLTLWCKGVPRRAP